MKRKTDDYDEEELKETGNLVKWMGEEGDDEEEEWKLDLPMNPCQWQIDDDDTKAVFERHIQPL